MRPADEARKSFFTPRDDRHLISKINHGDIILLLGGLDHFIIFPYCIYGTIIPFDFHIFQRGRSTTNQIDIVGNNT